MSRARRGIGHAADRSPASDRPPPRAGRAATAGRRSNSAWISRPRSAAGAHRRRSAADRRRRPRRATRARAGAAGVPRSALAGAPNPAESHRRACSTWLPRRAATGGCGIDAGERPPRRPAIGAAPSAVSAASAAAYQLSCAGSPLAAARARRRSPAAPRRASPRRRTAANAPRARAASAVVDRLGQRPDRCSLRGAEDRAA